MAQSRSNHIANMAQELGILEDRNVWCAGNEAVWVFFEISDFKTPVPITSMNSYIFQAWLSMISGPAIDECRASMRNTQSRGFSARKEQHTRPMDELDEDFDPNDIIVESDAQGSNDGSDTDYGSDY